jgi:hypothetical protein
MALLTALSVFTGEPTTIFHGTTRVLLFESDDVPELNNEGESGQTFFGM